jgi:hypothetical protein
MRVVLVRVALAVLVRVVRVVRVTTQAMAPEKAQQQVVAAVARGGQQVAVAGEGQQWTVVVQPQAAVWMVTRPACAVRVLGRIYT